MPIFHYKFPILTEDEQDTFDLDLFIESEKCPSLQQVEDLLRDLQENDEKSYLDENLWGQAYATLHSLFMHGNHADRCTFQLFEGWRSRHFPVSTPAGVRTISIQAIHVHQAEEGARAQLAEVNPWPEGE